MNCSALCAFLLIPFVLACFALSPRARATCQEGCLTNNNTVLGDDALLDNTGSQNTAIGFNALYSNTTAGSNTAIGWSALYSNTTGASESATGWGALRSNTTGYGNTAHGVGALYSNTTGNDNTADGISALYSNTTGNYNTVSGVYALSSNEVGSENTAMGYFALGSSTGSFNTAIGDEALYQLRNGNNNIALGDFAGYGVVGGSNNIIIGDHGLRDDSAVIRIGMRLLQRSTYVAGINGATVPDGVAVIVDRYGHLGTISSSKRLKDAIRPMDKASEAILALKPVTFRYKREIDPDGIPQFGLVAEDVETVNPDLVARDDEGKPYTVRYEAVNAMLLNEFLKEHSKVEHQEVTIAQQERKIQEQEATIAELKREFHSKLAEQQKRIEALTKGLERVSAQLEADRSVPQALAKNP